MTPPDCLSPRAEKSRYGHPLIIAAVIVVLGILLMYLVDRQQEHDFKLHSLEARMDVMEEWGSVRQQQAPLNTLPSARRGRGF